MQMMIIPTRAETHFGRGGKHFVPQIVVVVYDERQMPDGPDMTSVLGMFEDGNSWEHRDVF